MKVLHAPANVGSHPSGLARAERALGVESTTLSCYPETVTEDTAMTLRFGRSRVINEFKRQRFFWSNFLRYDVFHFNFGGSFFSYGKRLGALDFWDLPVLKLAGRKVVVTYQGCDARQQDYCTAHFQVCPCAEPDCYGGICTPSRDELKRRRIRRMLRYADHVWALNPDLLRVLPGAEFMPYASVDLAEWRPVPPSADARLRVLHAPTDRGAKGSRYIRQAMEKIAVKRPEVEYREVANVPHDHMKAVCETADLVIDQVLAGWYGGFAVEAMALGKPVVCYLREEDLQFIPPEMRAEIPVIRAEPGNLHEVLSAAVASKRRLAEIGERGRAYVERWHDPLKVARRAIEVYLTPAAKATKIPRS